VVSVPIRDWQISYGEESSYGTEVTPDQFLLARTVDPSERVNLKRIRHAGNRGYFIQILGKKEYSGSFEYLVQNGKFLKFALGACSDSGSDPYTHEITENDTLPSFTLEVAMGSFVRRYAGCKVSKLTISNAIDEPLRASVDWIAQSVTKYGTATSVTDVTTEPYVFSQGAVTINSQAAAGVQSFDWTFDNGSHAIHHLGDDELEYLIGGPRSSEVSMEIVLLDSTYWDLLTAGTEFDAYIVYTRGANDTLRIDWFDCKLDEVPIPGPEDAEVITQTLAIRPKSTKITVVDSIASY